jgi:hypothetical protein
LVFGSGDVATIAPYGRRHTGEGAAEKFVDPDKTEQPANMGGRVVDTGLAATGSDAAYGTHESAYSHRVNGLNLAQIYFQPDPGTSHLSDGVAERRG